MSSIITVGYSATCLPTSPAHQHPQTTSSTSTFRQRCIRQTSKHTCMPWDLRLRQVTAETGPWVSRLVHASCGGRGTAVTGMMPLQHMTDAQALRSNPHSGGDGRLSVFPMDTRVDIRAGGCGHVQAPRGLGSDRGSERRSHAGPLQLHGPGKLLFLS